MTTATHWKVVESNWPDQLVVGWSDGLMAAITPSASEDRTWTTVTVNTGDEKTLSHDERVSLAALRREMAKPVLGALLTGNTRGATWYHDPTLDASAAGLCPGFRANEALTYKGQLVDIRLWYRPGCKGVGDAFNA